MTALVTFLGKGRDSSSTGYRTATYRFPDGHTQTTAFFGLALADWMDVDRVVILGTPTSMWDVFVEQFAVEGEEEARLALIEAVAGQGVNESLLESVRPLIEQAVGRPCHLELIPLARDEAEQLAILERITEIVRQKEPVVFDVTHGFRHLGMLTLASARLLAALQDITVAKIYYGALEMMQDGIAPVLELTGLERVQRWTEALAHYEASGDYGVFADLLVADGLDRGLAERLKRAFQREQVLQIAQAAKELKPVVQVLKTMLAGASELFRVRLLKAMRWVDAPDLAEQQRILAYQALARRDFLRAAILGQEALVSKLVLAKNLNPEEYAAREQVEQRFQEELRNQRHPKWRAEAYWLLKNLRNAMAHATKPRGEYQSVLAHPERLQAELQKALQRLLQE
ncbi:MAG: TIGR02221 family CRISPR-associated protein [Methylohalobius sp.]|nr:TIGR02221 family CRISPR-associated protein [Methylohalobius sp.]